ncbi:MAG TPA: hypothetical protein VE781_04840, partial [Kineosporiaceae bacterium]|nr:hypothetical protein [Kineosporiaceae bacterium]
MGRHGGRSDGRTDGAPAPHPAGTSSRSAGAVATAAGSGHAPGAARWWDDPAAAGRATVADPWWDDAPVPPPVVVASADGRTPAVTFAPDADPFSAGGLFAPAAGRDGEPSVVVHAAPDAAVARASRRSRPAAPASAPRGVDPVLDTGSLVRPYVPAVQLPEGADGSSFEVLVAPAPDAVVPDVTVVHPQPETAATVPPLRRSRRTGGPLDRVVEAAPAAPVPAQPVGDWSAPWSREAEQAAPRSLFEPAARREPEAVWAAPGEQGLPSRKALRAKERAAAEVAALPGIAGKELSGRTAGRRIAKSGVLAVTALGVVAASAPNAFSALGWHLPIQPGG